MINTIAVASVVVLVTIVYSLSYYTQKMVGLQPDNSAMADIKCAMADRIRCPASPPDTFATRVIQLGLCGHFWVGFEMPVASCLSRGSCRQSCRLPIGMDVTTTFSTVIWKQSTKAPRRTQNQEGDRSRSVPGGILHPPLKTPADLEPRVSVCRVCYSHLLASPLSQLSKAGTPAH